MHKTSNLESKEYLEQFRISDKKYIIGVFQEGITIYKQQVRALSIFRALVDAKLLKREPDFWIGIIGGGVAGLTFASAALKAGFRVRIYEQHHSYLHMQSGCTIRKVHPNIYDWPEPGSTFPFANLPILSWRYDTAENVCKQILKGFAEVKSRVRPLGEYFEERLETRVDEISYGTYGEKEHFKVYTTKEDDEEKNIKRKKEKPPLFSFCDIMIFATGYGIEKGVSAKERTPSYWRNDSLDQTILNRKSRKFIISGSGDGGLMDLFRLKIKDFNYDIILQALSSLKDRRQIIKKLEIIRNNALQSTEEEVLAFYKFNKINRDVIVRIFSRLKERKLIREETNVILNSLCNKFEDAINLKKVSILNAFLAYILHENGCFKYVGGILSKHNRHYSTNSTVFDLHSSVIIRYGPNKYELLNKFKFSKSERKRLGMIEMVQKKNTNYKSFYDFNEIERLFKEKRNKETIDKEIEYLTSDTELFFQSFLSVLNRLILGKAKSRHFRITMHRCLLKNGQYYFQQLSPHLGPNLMTKNGIVGQIYPMERGSVGYSFTTGLPLLIQKKDPDKYYELLKCLKVHDNYINNENIKSTLTMPLLANIYNKGKKPKKATTLVLFMDSSEIDFFKTPGLIETIIHSLSGFMDSLDLMLKARKILMSQIEYVPKLIARHPSKHKIEENVCYVDILSDNHVLSTEKSVLTFDKFHSFDIINNNFGAFL